jgi:hypothetical protein
MKYLPHYLLMTVVLLASGQLACAQKNPFATHNKPMKRPPPDPGAPVWHTLRITPRPDLPEIHFYDKLNPVWWFGNLDDPEPPPSYRPDDPHRKTMWAFRNPFHNLTFYVIGVADKPSYRSGYYPQRVSHPHGGWHFAVTRRHVLLLPFVSYNRDWCTFYLGWRTRGTFGAKLNIPGNPRRKAEAAARQTRTAAPVQTEFVRPEPTE